MTITTTGIQDGNLGTRVEIGTMFSDSDLTNVFLLGLARMQAMDYNDPKSWFQLAGIHGRPYQAFDGVGKPGSFGGYCTHSSTIFPTWHRPYLALFEQALGEQVRAAANEFQGADRDRFVAAAARWRLPYWDWAADADLPAIIAEQQTVTVTTPSGPQSIPNPLYAYVFPRAAEQHLADGLPDERTWEGYRETVRYPRGQNSQPAVMEAQLDNNRLTLRDRTYNLLTQATNWVEFATDAAQQDANPLGYDSLESIHNSIHGLTGNNGHMGVVDFAAFDPVFWLHHCNVDRLLTIWQAINPTAFVTPLTNDVGTFAEAPGTVENSSTPLWPFRSNPNSFWTSDAARDTRTFGYTYPELAQWASLGTEDKRVRLRTTVNQLYGATAPSTALRTTGSGTAAHPWGAPPVVAPPPRPVPQPAQPTPAPAPVPKPKPQDPIPVHPMPEPAPQKPFPAPAPPPQHTVPVHHDRELPSAPVARGPPVTLVGAAAVPQPHQPPPVHAPPPHQQQPPPPPLGSAHPRPPPPHHAPTLPHTVPNHHVRGHPVREYVEWIANIKVAKHAGEGTFFVHIFLGDFNADPRAWPTEKNLVGSHVIFTSTPSAKCNRCNADRERDAKVTGTIPLTGALGDRFGSVYHLTVDKVAPYLVKELHWRLTRPDGTEIPRDAVPSLRISVGHATVEVPDAEDEFPRWKQAHVEFDVTRGRPGGAGGAHEA